MIQRQTGSVSRNESKGEAISAGGSNVEVAKPFVQESALAMKLQKLNVSGSTPVHTETPASPRSPDAGSVSSSGASSGRVEKPAHVTITSGSRVAVSHFTNGTVYLRSRDGNDEKTLVQLSMKLYDHCSASKCLDNPPKKRQLLVAKYSMDDSFNRFVVSLRAALMSLCVSI